MFFFEFERRGTTSILAAAFGPDPKDIPSAAKAYDSEWTFLRGCETGDGTQTPEFDAAVQERIAADGYYIYFAPGIEPIGTAMGCSRAGENPVERRQDGWYAVFSQCVRTPPVTLTDLVHPWTAFSELAVEDLYPSESEAVAAAKVDWMENHQQTVLDLTSLATADASPVTDAAYVVSSEAAAGRRKVCEERLLVTRKSLELLGHWIGP